MNKGKINLTIEKQVNRFINGKHMKDIVPTETILTELTAFFEMIDIRSLKGNDKRRLANFCRYGLGEYIYRFNAVKKLKTNSLEQSIMLYGEKEGKIRYNNICEHNKNNKNIGLTDTEIFLKRNKKKSLKSITITENHRIELGNLLANFASLDVSIYDWDRTISNFIKYNLDDYIDRIKQLKNIHSGELKSFVLRYGEKKGQTRYKEVNKKKVKGLDHSPEKQKERNKKFTQKSKGSSLYTHRSKHYWLRKGFSEEEAIKKASELQRRGKIYWINRYGEENGLSFWIDRNKRWLETMANKSPAEKRKILRKQSVQYGKASKESLKIFSPLKEYAISKSLKVYLGDKNNLEYFISDNTGFHSYDFTIPKLKLIIEYHGEKWHPNPNMPKIEKDNWRNPKSNISYEEQHNKDILKESKAINHGFIYLVIWSSDDKYDSINKMILLINNLCDLLK